MQTPILALLVAAVLTAFAPACSENDTVPPISAADAIKLGDSVRTAVKAEADAARPTLLSGKAWTNSETKTVVNGSAVSTTQAETLDVTVSLTNLTLSGGIWTATGSCSYKYTKNVNNDENTITFNGLAAPFRLTSAATNRSLSFRNLVIDTRQDAETSELTTTISGGISIDGFSYSYPRN